MLKPINPINRLAGRVRARLAPPGPPASAPEVQPAPAAAGPEQAIVLEGVDRRLETTRFRVDHRPHITVNGEVCQDCSTRACVYVCPANLFTLLSDGTILFNYEQCFECGTCYVACNREGAISWSYPRGGYGVAFREA